MKRTELVVLVTKLQGARDTLTLLLKAEDPEEAYIRLQLLAWLLDCSPCRTQRELAAKCRRSPGRVSQMLRVLNRQLGNSRS